MGTKKEKKIEILTIWCHGGKPIYLRRDGKARSIESKLLREKRTYTLSVRGEKLDSDPLGHPVDPDNKINRNRGEKKNHLTDGSSTYIESFIRIVCISRDVVRL